MFSDPVIIALITVMIPALFVPTIIVVVNNHYARKIRLEEKLADYERADELESRRKKDADEVARLLKNNTAIQVEAFGELNGKTEQIHTLVNSNLTEEKEGKLLILEANLVTLEEMSDLRTSIGKPESGRLVEQIDSMHKAVAKLKTELEKRREITEAAAVERKATSIATKSAVAAITASGPMEVTIKQDDHNPVPVKPVILEQGKT